MASGERWCFAACDAMMLAEDCWRLARRTAATGATSLPPSTGGMVPDGAPPPDDGSLVDKRIYSWSMARENDEDDDELGCKTIPQADFNNRRPSG